MATKAPVTWKKGTFQIATRSGKKEVKGYVSSSGLGVHKGIDRSDYAIVQLSSGLVVKNADKQAQAKEEAERISHVVNWHKKVKPSRDLAEKIQYAARGERRPSNRKTDEYDLKAYARKGGHLVDHEYARSYKGQEKERGHIRQYVQGKHHISYRIDVRNTTKNRRIK